MFPVEEEAGDPPSPGDHEPRHRRAGFEEDIIAACGTQPCPFSSCDKLPLKTQVVIIPTSSFKVALKSFSTNSLFASPSHTNGTVKHGETAATSEFVK